MPGDSLSVPDRDPVAMDRVGREDQGAGALGDTPPMPPAHEPVAILEPPRGWFSLDLRDIWEYRELLYFLVWRDVKVRYKQTALGVAWALLQPLLTMIVFTLIFGRLVKVPSDGIPYPVFAFCALLPWNYFATSLATAANSVVGNAQLLSKVYFPRLVIPMAAVAAGLIDLAIAFAVLVGLMSYYGVTPKAAILTLPLFVLFATVTALGSSLWLAALNVRYRDVRHVVPFLIQFWMYATPVFYPSSLVPERWRLLYGLNPMAGVVDGFRWAIVGGARPGALVAVSALTVVLVLVSGILYFRHMEKSFADVV